MKTKIFFIVLLSVPFFAMGQIKSTELPGVKVSPPVFTGVSNVIDVINHPQQQSINDYFTENFKFPEYKATDNVEGTGVIRFTVKPTGELAEFEVVNSISPDIDAEFLSVLKTTEGMWKPGDNNGEFVEMEKEVSMMVVSDKTEKPNPEKYFAEIAEKRWKRGNKLFLIMDKPERALKHYDYSNRYSPYQTSTLLYRGLCRYALGDCEGACIDWNRVNAISRYNADDFIDNLCGLKGFDEMIGILNN